MFFLDNSTSQVNPIGESADEQWGILGLSAPPTPSLGPTAPLQMPDVLAAVGAAAADLGSPSTFGGGLPAGTGQTLPGMQMPFPTPGLLLDPGMLLDPSAPLGLTLPLQPVPASQAELGPPSQSLMNLGASSVFRAILPPDPAISSAPHVLAPDDPTVPTEHLAQGQSHICTVPGCGKGFASRWSLERHTRHHDNQELDEVEDADSFVERRLRERLKAAETALDKTRERLSNAAKHRTELQTEVRPRPAAEAHRGRWPFRTQTQPLTSLDARISAPLRSWPAEARGQRESGGSQGQCQLVATTTRN